MGLWQPEQAAEHGISITDTWPTLQTPGQTGLSQGLAVGDEANQIAT